MEESGELGVHKRDEGTSSRDEHVVILHWRKQHECLVPGDTLGRGGVIQKESYDKDMEY